MTFADAVTKTKNKTVARTANGMKAKATSGTAVLDLFGVIGSARGKDITAQFTASLVENEDLTLRMLQWVRDIRGGAGERETFRKLLASIESANPALAGKLMHKVPMLGRWDDLFTYKDPMNRNQAFAMFAEAFVAKDGLASKWAPRKGPIAVELTKYLGLSPKAYRQLIVSLTNVVETQMCAKEWDKINFSHVPSVASARYQKAFGRNAKETYSAYIRELQKPEAERTVKVKINSGAIFPYDVLKSVFKGNEAVADEQWKALPNYMDGSKVLPMIDVSGSMGSFGSTPPSPMDISVSLGLYCSDKNIGPFKDLILTFSGKSDLYKISGTLSQKVKQMQEKGKDWGSNTDLHGAFDNILRVAVSNKVDSADMPGILLILSDLQFDQCSRFDDSAMQMIKRKYHEAGYEMPKIIFWNLSMHGKDNGNTPVKFDKNGTGLISGFSPAIMKSVLANDLEDYTPWNIMEKTLMDSRYDL